MSKWRNLLLAPAHSAAAGLVLLASSAWFQAAHSQSVGAETTPEQQQRLKEGIAGAAQASSESRWSTLSEGEDVTYKQVLADPDNVELNAAYARAQIRKGDILGASTTLERVILTHPDADEVKLIYGMVLYRLDDTVTAQNVLSGIDPNRLTAEQRAERDRVLALIELRKKRLRQSVSLTIGEHFDTNRNAAPNAGSILINDIPFTLGGTARVQKDWGTLLNGAYEAEYDLGTDPRFAVYGGASVLSDMQARTKTLNNQTGGLSGGVRFEDGPWSAQGGLFWNSMNLQSDYYLSDYGLQAHVGYRILPELEAFTDLRYNIQAFHNVPADSSGHDNSGTVPTAWVGLNWKAVPTHILGVATGVARRYATANYDSNSRLAARLSDTWLLGQGQFLFFGGEYGGNVYDANNATFSANTRHDHDIRVNVTYGVPLGTISGAVGGGELPGPLNDMVLAVNMEYYRSLSNLPNYTYSNIRTQTLLSKHWEF